MIGRKHENTLDEIVENMQKEKKEITKETIRSYIMTKVIYGNKKLGMLTTKPILEYCEKKGIQ